MTRLPLRAILILNDWTVQSQFFISTRFMPSPVLEQEQLKNSSNIFPPVSILCLVNLSKRRSLSPFQNSHTFLEKNFVNECGCNEEHPSKTAVLEHFSSGYTEIVISLDHLFVLLYIYRRPIISI